MSHRAVAPGIIDFSGERPRLVGGRRISDGRIVFPMPSGSEAQLYEPLHLAEEGHLWSYTVQRFRPKSPPYAGDDDETTFKPFALGYVELPGQVIVESRLATEDFDALRVGLPMVFQVVPFRKDADGTDLLTYAFAPA